jgi:hypothetical protein
MVWTRRGINENVRAYTSILYQRLQLVHREAQFEAGFKEYVSKLAETDKGLLGWLTEKVRGA